jgi:hypothetical protein
MRFASSPVVAVLALLVGGCQSSSTPSASDAPPATPQRAIVVTGGNAGATTVFLPSSDPENPLMMSTSAGMTECPECKAAAIKYFETGVLDPKCSRTGATRCVLVPPTPYIGHN